MPVAIVTCRDKLHCPCPFNVMRTEHAVTHSILPSLKH
jgi:hypothetical protein